MVKTKTIETVEEYSEDGKLVRKTVTETEETDDNPNRYGYVPPWNTYQTTPFQYDPKITCQVDSSQYPNMVVSAWNHAEDQPESV